MSQSELPNVRIIKREISLKKRDFRPLRKPFWRGPGRMGQRPRKGGSYGEREIF